MNSWLTKRNVFLVGLTGTVAITVVVILAMTDYCYDNDACVNFFGKLDPWNFLNYVLFTPPLLLLSLVTYKMRVEVFASWVKFSQWWVPLTFIAILLTPRSSGGFIEVAFKETLSFACAVAFLAISLILIAYKSYKLRGK